MKDLGLLVLRLTVGTLMAGHGSQKLFGWFKGPGLTGTAGFMEQLGMAPGHVWGRMAAMTEFSGGVLTALGFLSPIGPLNIVAAMAVASRKVHWKLPLWAGQGGAELPLTNMAAAIAIAFAGPGRLSLDGIFGIRFPRWFSVLAALTTIGAAYAAAERPDIVAPLFPSSNSAPTPNDESDLEVETRPAQETSNPTTV